MRVLLILLLVWLSGCASFNSYTIKDQNYALTEIKQIAGAAIGGIRTEENGGRDLISRYYTRQNINDFEVDFSKRNERLFTIVTILGDRRPYDIRITIVVEKKINGRFVEYSKDKRLAQRIGEELRNRLIESLEKRNVIDDFRVF
jgi:uncharacterized lipoprotein YmbA